MQLTGYKIFIIKMARWDTAYIFMISLHKQLEIPWASYQIREIAGCACAENALEQFARHRLQTKPLVSDPGMHPGTCITHVPWCMPGSLIRRGGEYVPGIPGACVTRKFTYLARGPWLHTLHCCLWCPEAISIHIADKKCIFLEILHLQWMTLKKQNNWYVYIEKWNDQVV